MNLFYKILSIFLLTFLTSSLKKSYMKSKYRVLLKEYAFILLSSAVIVMFSIYWLSIPSSGLLAEYYPNSNWEGKPVLSLLEKNFNDDDMDFAENLMKYANFPREYFSITWNGWIRIDKDGIYRFGTKSDDGSFLKIDKQFVVDNGGLHASQEAWGEISLTKGMHHINITYFNAESAHKFSVFWMPPQSKPKSLASNVLFSRPLSPASEVLSRHSFMFLVFYLALWGALLSIIAVKVGGLRQKRYRRRNLACVTFNTAVQLLLIAFAVIVIADNLSMLIAKQPWRIGPLVPKPDRKLSTILRVKGGGDSDDAFCATLRALYPGRTLWLPQDGVFKNENLLQKAAMRSVKIYRSQLALTPEEVRRLPSRVYHRFIYNPFKYRPDGTQLDRSHYNEIDPTSQPKLLFLMTPKRSGQMPLDDIVAIPFERNLYFLSYDQLPERIRGEIYE